MARHLHQQAGGDPSQGPVREMANPTPSPEAGRDFPDAPGGDGRSVGGDLSDQQLADMADRLGLGDDEHGGEPTSPLDALRSPRVAGIGAVAALIAALFVLRRRRS
ncbi:MAG: hypothetical protein R8G01_04655 [Ilumatobacteraceae bacterium]|nr:hypothetical protein [Ilumatobacteraceae bacterium]